MTAKEIINIDLNLHSDRFKKEHLIQKEAFNLIYEKIKERLNNEDNHNSSAFFIHGTRGAGKSCFLNTFTKFLAKESGLSIIELINMDPTKVEIGENILVSIVEALHSKIKKSATHQNFGSNFDEKYEEWKKKLQSLATGIKLLNEKDGCLKSLDDTVALEWGMERVASGMMLAQHFKELVEKASEILKTSAFIIAIDDADTNFKTGKEVLEVIRKYLDIPRLIVIVAGDLKLYTHLVRNIFADDLHNSKDLHSESEKCNRIKLLDHMVDQYLKKLFPIKNRIELKTLKLLMQKNDYYIQPFNASVDQIFTHIISIGFSLKNGMDLKEYKNFILDQPIRSIVQFLESLDLQINGDITKKRKISESLISLFAEDLYENSIDTQKINDDDISIILENIFDLLIQDGDQDNSFYFRPRANTESLKATFTTVSSNISLKTENNFAIVLDYMLQGVGSQFVYNKVRAETDKISLKEFKNYFSIGKNNDSLNWAWHYCGLTGNSTKLNKKSLGIIEVGLTNNKAEEVTLSQLLNNFKSKNKDIPSIMYSLIQVNNGSTRKRYSSIFNILGLISQHLRLSDYNKQQIGGENERNEDLISLYEDQLNISSISSIGINNDSKNYENEDDDDKDYNDHVDYKIVHKMDEWSEDISTLKISPSTLLLGKIWKRFHSNINNISDRNAKKGFASLMELYAGALVNAFLVEEVNYHIKANNEIKIKSNNIATSLQALTTKMNSIKDKKNFSAKDDLPLTYIISSCPLILGLLRKSNYVMIYHFAHGEKASEETTAHIDQEFEKLDNVIIK